MSYIPARAMHRAAPAAPTHDKAPERPSGMAALFRRAADRLSPRTWTAVAIAAGAVATGITAAALVDPE